MTNQDIKQYLIDNSEEKYKNFSEALVPGCVQMYGVRIPALRMLAKQIAAGDWRTYLDSACDDSFEEIMLQGMTIGYIKEDIDIILERFKKFIPKVCDWSLCDCTCATLKIVKKNREKVWDFLVQYVDSPHEFEQRIVAVMLMDYFIHPDYIDRYFEIMDRLKHPGYYRMMGVAWAVSTAYCKMPKETGEYLKRCKLDDVTYNKAIQKMLESNRISKDDKEILKKMKR